MTKKWLAVITALSLAGFWCLWRRSHVHALRVAADAAAPLRAIPMIPPPTAPKPSRPAAAAPRPVSARLPEAAAPVTAAPAPRPAASAVPEVPAAIALTSAPPAALSPAELHTELIPQNITILDCDYSQDIVGPGTTFGVDIDGSGFSQEFQKMIRLESGSSDVRIKNMRLVTANQIHADLEVNASAQTSYVYPSVWIQDLPVFRAEKPFGVVRAGEVLDIKLIGVSQDGHTQPFQVVTNLDETMAKQLWVESTVPGVTVKRLQPRLPFAVDGVLDIVDPTRGGECGLVASLYSHEIFRRENLVRLVLPDLGRNGWTYGINCPEPFHRPGDTIRLTLVGSGFSPRDLKVLKARVQDLQIRPASFSYVSPTEIEFTFTVPPAAAERSYEVTVLGAHDRVIRKAQDVFTVVPPLWVARVTLAPQATPGGTSTLRVIGRGLTPDFSNNLQVSADEPGIRASGFKFIDASTLTADITFSAAVAPGDYWLHLASAGKPVQPHFGSVITVAGAR